MSSDRRATRSAPKGGSAAERKFVRVGMTEGEVVHRLGRPDVESSGRGRRGREWSYLPADGDADTLTTFTFAGGKVVNVERRITR